MEEKHVINFFDSPDTMLWNSLIFAAIHAQRHAWGVPLQAQWEKCKKSEKEVKIIVFAGHHVGPCETVRMQVTQNLQFFDHPLIAYPRQGKGGAHWDVLDYLNETWPREWMYQLVFMAQVVNLLVFLLVFGFWEERIESSAGLYIPAKRVTNWNGVNLLDFGSSG